MSGPAAPAFSTAGKKAVHVKWAGKTIALGTFPASEADEKCARAKALTRAWRSTMRPKPTREWVMLELEKLGVRVVSGRLGRKAGEDDDEMEGGLGTGGVMGVPNPGARIDVSNAGIAGSTSIGGLTGENPAESGGNTWGTDAELNRFMARRNSSLGFSMLNDGRRGSLGSLGGLMGFDSTDTSILGMGVGSDQQRRTSSLGLGSLAGGALGMSVNPNQHYEMLKLHHMNLLNEIQETTLMMNLYQQQQLQQQQQQLQQQATSEGLSSSHPGFDHMLNHSNRGSLGLGGSQLEFTSQQQLLMQQQQQLMPNGQSTLPGGPVSLVAPGTQGAAKPSSPMKKPIDSPALVNNSKATDKKRTPNKSTPKSPTKKVKLEDKNTESSENPDDGTIKKSESNPV